ncbi:MarR family winged helix-turn-helix transcriptional regulator [Rhodococcus sp. NPDC003318]|uniref:MarR family winged helix-turn-helix transcriptional regulator n=1 Tax=Rhodococcus sp. NPDC003318 TaxID=3364503 RepID=UPI003693AC4D
MTVQTATAEDLVEEVFLFGRTLRGVLGGSDESGVAPALIGVLHVLAANAPCRQNELAVRLCVSQSSLSRQIAELVDAGLVERHADPADGRASIVQLSEAGHELLANNKEFRAARLLTMLAEWSQDEAEDALTALRHLKQTFSTIPVRTPATGHSTPQRGYRA